VNIENRRFYTQRGLLIDINGEQPIQRVFADFRAAIDRLGANRRPEVGRQNP